MPVILDISSDEESGLGELGQLNYPFHFEPKEDDYDWLSEMLGLDGKEKDDSDEVVIVGEVSPTKQCLKSKSSKLKEKDIDDEDCVILDGDPENQVALMNDSDNGQEDELQIVGEKGQIACRDYPHPRHLCAKFPFSSTSHEKHCKLCHCYVCDSIAPCTYWGSGLISFGHCHATDKEETWKNMRKSRTATKRSQVPSHDVIQLETNYISSNRVTVSTTLTNCVPQNYIPMQSTVRPCTSTNFTIPNIMSHGRNHKHLSANNRSPTRSAEDFLGLRRDRVRDNFNMGCRFVSSNTMFKRTGVAGVAKPMNNSNRARSSQHVGNFPPSAPLPLPNIFSVLPNVNAGSYAHLGSLDGNLESVVGNKRPSEVNIYRQTIPQTNDSQNFLQHQNQSQHVNLNNFQVADQSQGASCTIYQNVDQSRGAGQNIYQNANQSQSSNLNSFQFGNQIQKIRGPGCLDLDFDMVNDYGQNSGQSSAENSQLQSAGSTNGTLPVKDNFHFTPNLNVDSVNVVESNWFLESQSDPVAFDCSLPPYEPNALSPDIGSIDPDMLYFDLETSWNGLTQL